MPASEPSPPSRSSANQLPSAAKHGTQRRQRKSRTLDQEIHAGDTGPSLGTGLASIHSSDSLSATSSDGLVRPPSEQKMLKPKFLPRCKHFAITHTWMLPLAILLAFLSLYAVNPTESNILHPFIFLSYRLPLDAGADPSTPPHYGKGRWDIAFVSFYTILLSFTREFIMQELLRPLARRCGLRSEGKQSRFMEQMYTAIYFILMGPAGLYVMSRTPVWYFNTRGMYEFFPHRSHEAVFKFYYLFQAAYWAQQAIVLLLGMEKPRKDFKELVAHHIVTLALIALSYRFHFTYMGIAVYIAHDISDFFLANSTNVRLLVQTSKSLNYINSSLQGPYFGACILIWIYLRHIQTLRIILSLFTEFQTVGPYELNWETQQYKCLLSNVITFGLLAALQALNLFWLYCLFRSAYRFVVHKIAKDDRSDDDEPELETDQLKDEAVRVLTGKVDALLFINGNSIRNDRANHTTKATGNGTAVPPVRRNNAR
ncbi:MAG: hypothetical protein Q9197_004703 [Variospora fuerteventurae]